MTIANGTPKAFKLSVAICGGGITGLALANLLTPFLPENHPEPNSAIDWQLYESAGEFKEIGAGIAMWARALDAFDYPISGAQADYLTRVKARIFTIAPDGHRLEDGSKISFEMRRSDSLEGGQFLTTWTTKKGNFFFHRAKFLSALEQDLPRDRIHFRKRLVSYTELNNKVVLKFKDGTTEYCDVLIAADGIKSAVRAQMLKMVSKEENRPDLENLIHPRWSGTVAYRSLLDSEDVKRVCPGHPVLRIAQMLGGKSQHIIMAPIAGGRFVNMVCFVSDFSKAGTQYPSENWVTEVPHEELMSHYSGWEPWAEELCKLMKKPSKWAVHELDPLPFFSKGRVAIIGDAAHAMTPHLGIGAGMGIEDARFLSRFLISPEVTAENVNIALEAYSSSRVKTTTEILLLSREQGKIWEMQGRETGEDGEKIVSRLKKVTDGIQSWDADGEIDDCLKWIREQVQLSDGLEISE